MIASFALAEKTLPGRGDEGLRVLRNTATIGAFLASPIHLYLMVRALGADGYGRWWWTFVLLEAASLIGVFGTDLYVRTQIPQCEDDQEGTARAHAVVGTSVAIVTVLGVAFAVLQIVLAVPLAHLQDDEALIPFLVTLAFQPVTWSIGAVLGAALQSRHYLGALAVLRGIVFPAMVAVVYFIGWRAELPVHVTLVLMLCNSLLALALTLWLYARHFSLRATVRAALRPSLLRPAFKNGGRLIVPLVLYTIGGKLDLYAMGAYWEPAVVGLYAACLQMSALVPSVRGLFDPIAQTQIGALYTRDPAALAGSLRKLTRLCIFAMAPAFVITVGVGEPILGWLVGASVPQVFEPIVLLTLGNLMASIALAAWIVPMLFSGRLLTFIATTAGLLKLGLLVWLVPRYGAVGASIATAAGVSAAWHLQSYFGARGVFQPFPASILGTLAIMTVVSAGARLLYEALAGGMSQMVAVVVTAGASMAVLGGGLFLLMTPVDRSELRRLLGMRAAGVPSDPS